MRGLTVFCEFVSSFAGKKMEFSRFRINLRFVFRIVKIFDKIPQIFKTLLGFQKIVTTVYGRLATRFSDSCPSE